MGDVVGVEVEGLYATGKTIAGRSGHGESQAAGLQHGLVGASGTVGHPIVRSALSGFVDDHVMGKAAEIGVMLTSGGHNVSNVAATASDSDQEAATALTTPISTTDTLGQRINRQA